MQRRLIDKLHYPVGRLGWKLAARAGLPLRVGVVVQRDEEAGVYCAHSPNLPGLHVEGETLDELVKEINGAVAVLIALSADAQTPTATELRISQCAMA
jgi:predicted RNase H-like HicB family nuclease